MDNISLRLSATRALALLRMITPNVRRAYIQEKDNIIFFHFFMIINLQKKKLNCQMRQKR